MFPIRSLLFVPGSRPERFGKAMASGADLVCIDLEDAVSPLDKTMARDAALAALGDPRLAIRINGLKTRAGLADLLALSDHPPSTVLVPMVESAAEVEVVHAVLGPKSALVPLIETVRGLDAGRKIARAPGVVAMMFGGADFAAQIGTALAWEPLATARAQFVLACASASIAAIDVPWIQLDDSQGLALEAERARASGFSAKAAIHPAQVAAINAAFAPSAAEIDEAIAAIAAFRDAGEAAVRFRGKMLEAPMMPRYQQILDWQGNAHA
jgi:citrate lyase beta subunit